MFETMQTKENLIKQLDNFKSEIQKEISLLISNNNNDGLENILDESQKELLKLFEEKMRILQKENKKYFKLITSVGSFYLEFLNAIIPHEMNGYSKKAKKSSFLNLMA